MTERDRPPGSPPQTAGSPAIAHGGRPTPPVPRPPRSSWLSRSYGVLGAGVLVFYLAAGLLGWDVRSTEREVVPASVRTAPGGYRTFHFWHSGYHGGK